MGSRYLTDLASVCRGAGLLVQEEPGWQTRARGSGGYNSGLPNHVMVHHTASGKSSDGQPDVNYMCYGSDNRPVANLYLSRSGKVWVMAAGATNTNGSGRDPCGTIANDSMNSSAIGIEAGNDGVGEPWPSSQQTAYTQLVNALCGHYGIANHRIHAHFEWAPDRKVDPAGPSQWSKPSGGGSNNMWRMDEFRADVPGGGGGGQPPIAKGDDVAVAIAARDGSSQQKAMTFAWQPGCRIGWITSDAQISVGLITGTLVFDDANQPLRNFGVAEIQDMINRYWAGGPKPPGFS
jgi:hypothetical protein